MASFAGVTTPARHLELRDLLEFGGDGVGLRMAGHKAIVLDAAALGLLREELIGAVGVTAARAVLTRFGYAIGWRMADALRAGYGVTDPMALSRIGARIYQQQGVIARELATVDGRGGGEFTWNGSFEATQHLLHKGRADVPVCWTLRGITSGFMSCALGLEIVVIEDRCLARGDAACHAVARTRQGWGDLTDDELAIYQRESLEASLQRITAALARADRRLREQRRALDLGAADPSGLCVRSPAMKRAVELARRVAQVDSTLLVTGETGAGKERIARLVHDASARAAGPFLAVNCAAVAESLLESELFGHVRGAFTGATNDRVGLFEAAHRGTLFLDEVGEIPPPMQVKLLRVLQEHEVRRVGENRGRSVDVRVIAATNRDLAGEVDRGHFRKDLFYRLRVVELEVPPLRERREDLLPLARTLLRAAAQRARRTLGGLSPGAADLLYAYPWPGNVRELENAMERAAALARGRRVEPEDLPDEVRARSGSPRHSERLEDVERAHILAVVEANGGNQARAALVLGIGTTTLYRKLKGYRRVGG